MVADHAAIISDNDISSMDSICAVPHSARDHACERSHQKIMHFDFVELVGALIPDFDRMSMF